MIASQPNPESPPALSTPIEVPELIKVSEAGFDVIEYANFLLAHLLREDAALLHAQFQNGIAVWLLRQRPKGTEGAEVEIARMDSVGDFRVVLARFGYYYMAVQLYGGFARRVLTHRGRQYACSIYMSNDNWTGYWIRVYAHVIAGQSGCT
jgi:hypothetical protein